MYFRIVDHVAFCLTCNKAVPSHEQSVLQSLVLDQTGKNLPKLLDTNLCSIFVYRVVL